jgi:SPOR domain
MKPRFSDKAKLAAAFLGFTLIIGSGMLLAFFGLNLGHDKGLKPRSGNDQPPSDEGFFYSTLGSTVAREEAALKREDPTPEELYTIELGVSERKEEAESMVAAMQAQGVDAFYTPLNHGGHVIYRIRRGLYRSREDADQAAIALRQKGQGEAAVVSLQ